MELDEVKAGDLIFTARPGQLQTLAELAGDPWRHVGVAAEVDGAMSCCEVAGDKFQFRAIAELTKPPHTAIGVARLPGALADCAANAADWVENMVAKDQLYAWDDVIMTGILLLVRRRAPAAQIEKVMAVVQEAEALARENPRPSDRQSFTCASFAYHAFAQAGANCTLQVTIEAPRSALRRNRLDQVSPPPLARLLAEAERGNLTALVEPLDAYSLLELSGIPEPADGQRIRSSSGSHMKPDQFVALARNLVRIFANVTTDDLPDRLVLDERWVSPGDLWRLENVELQALLPISGDD